MKHDFFFEDLKAEVNELKLTIKQIEYKIKNIELMVQSHMKDYFKGSGKIKEVEMIEEVAAPNNMNPTPDNKNWHEAVADSMENKCLKCDICSS